MSRTLTFALDARFGAKRDSLAPNRRLYPATAESADHGTNRDGQVVAGVRARTSGVPAWLVGKIRAGAAPAGNFAGHSRRWFIWEKARGFSENGLADSGDFAIKPLSSTERHDLLEVVEERHGRRSTLVTSQLPVKLWHEHLGEDPTVADALLDRLLSQSHRLELRGESLRRVAPSADNLTRANGKE